MKKQPPRRRASKLDETTESIWLRLVSRIASIAAPFFLGALVWFVQHEITTLESGMAERSKLLWEQIGKMIGIENETISRLGQLSQKVEDHQKADDHSDGVTQRYFDTIDRKLNDLANKK